MPGTPLRCLLGPSVSFWHSSEMLAGCLLNTGESVLEVAPLKVCQTSVCEHDRLFLWQHSYCIWVWPLVFGSVHGCIFHVPWLNASTHIHAVCAPACSGLSPNLSLCSTRYDLTGLCNFVLTMGTCLCLTRVPHQPRASQAFIFCPSVKCFTSYSKTS